MSEEQDDIAELVENLRDMAPPRSAPFPDIAHIYEVAADVIEELQKERNDWKRAAHDVDHSGGLILWSDKWSEMLQEYKWAYEDQKKAEARLSEAVKVMEPFAEAAECIDANDDYSSAPIWEHAAAMNITIGDLRRVQRFLATLGEENVR